MFCKFCTAHPEHSKSSSAFAKEGCNMLKHETLLKHAKSKSHTYSRECYLNRKARPCGALPQVLAQSRTAQQAEIQRGLEIKFNLGPVVQSPSSRWDGKYPGFPFSPKNQGRKFRICPKLDRFKLRLVCR